MFRGRAVWILLALGGFGSPQLRAQLSSIAATPTAISFTATDPDAGPVSSSPVTVNFVTVWGWPNRAWQLTVSTQSPSLTGCSQVPASAIQVRCTGVSVNRGGSGACSTGTFTLSTTPQVVASGVQGIILTTYTVNLSFSFTDQWRYPGSSACSINLVYTAYAP